MSDVSSSNNGRDSLSEASEQEDSVRSFIDELRLLSSLRHHNIVSFYGGCIKRINSFSISSLLFLTKTKKVPHFYIVMEFVEKGALNTILYDFSIPLSFQQQLQFALDTAKGMRCLLTSTLTPPPLLYPFTLIFHLLYPFTLTFHLLYPFTLTLHLLYPFTLTLHLFYPFTLTLHLNLPFKPHINTSQTLCLERFAL